MQRQPGSYAQSQLSAALLCLLTPTPTAARSPMSPFHKDDSGALALASKHHRVPVATCCAVMLTVAPQGTAEVSNTSSLLLCCEWESGAEQRHLVLQTPLTTQQRFTHPAAAPSPPGAGLASHPKRGAGAATSSRAAPRRCGSTHRRRACVGKRRRC